jgi:branched-subunit amino acid transport protein
MENWLIILGMVAVTYSVRLSVIALLGDTRLPDGLNRALRYVPPVALSAIVFPALLAPGGAR